MNNVHGARFVEITTISDEDVWHEIEFIEPDVTLTFDECGNCENLVYHKNYTDKNENRLIKVLGVQVSDCYLRFFFQNGKDEMKTCKLNKHCEFRWE